MRMAYTVQETAELLGCSEASIYLMCYNKVLAHNRIKGRGIKGAGKILISHKAIENWLEGECR
jgi:excisionase family DNA binding protein